jgi:hypothetical protein
VHAWVRVLTEKVFLCRARADMQRVCSFHVHLHDQGQGQKIGKKILLGAIETRTGTRIGTGEIGIGTGIDGTVTEIAGDEVGSALLLQAAFLCMLPFSVFPHKKLDPPAKMTMHMHDT